MPENTNPIELFFTKGIKLECLYNIIYNNIGSVISDNNTLISIKKLKEQKIDSFEVLINKINQSKNIPIIKLSEFDSKNKPFIYLIDDAFNLDAFNEKKYNECQIAFVHDDYRDKNPYTLPKTRNIILFVHSQTNENFKNAKERFDPETNTITRIPSSHDFLDNTRSNTSHANIIIDIINHYLELNNQ